MMRELTGAELDLVSGGKVYTSTVAGFTFTHDDKTGETTVGAGGYEAGRTPAGGGKHWNTVVEPPR